MKRGQNLNFLCIGLQKTGTSWLHSNLMKHAQIYLPSIKENRYFLEGDRVPKTNIIRILNSPHWHHIDLKRNLKSRLNFYSKITNLKNYRALVWDMNFFLMPHTDKWHVSLFRSNKISGDIEPMYCLLPIERIRQIKCLYPDLKIIILFRNPIEYAWSKAKMNQATHKGRNISEIPEKDFYGNFDYDFKQCSSYMKIINNWNIFFPMENMHINFYDKLVENPLEFFNDICHFLKVAKKETLSPAMTHKINVGLKTDLPEKFAVYLSKLYKETIDEMCENFEPYPQRWADNYAAILNK